MTPDLIDLLLSILAYEYRRREYPLVIDGQWVDVATVYKPPIINLSDDRPLWLQRDRSKAR